MGTILSTIYDAFRGISAAIALLSSISAEFNAALKRATKSPGLPNPQPTHSYWQNEPPFPELVDVRSSTLPEYADVAIIGSGIAGAAVARSLLHEWRRLGLLGEKEKKKKIIVLEARQLCSGATARNGGHIKPALYDAFSRFSKLFRPERAAALARFQHRHIQCLTDLCADEGIDVAEAREVETADLFLDEESFDKSVRNAERMQDWLPEATTETWKGSEAREKFHVNESVVGVITYGAGAIWAYRFVVSIWKRLLDEFSESIDIETTTPVTSIRTVADEAAGFPYVLHTPRGDVRVRQIVHATNAFASHLVPGLRNKITGVRAHMSAQQPGDQFPNCRGNRSWSVMYGDGFDYVTQRPTVVGEPQGHLMLGGGFVRSLKQGIDQVGQYDDSVCVDALTISHISGILPAIFSPNWGKGSTVEQLWSGILGMTGDRLPLVGRIGSDLTGRKVLDGEESEKLETGEWIAAGFAGEGMVWAWLSGTALGIMMAGTEEEDLSEIPGRPGGKLAAWFPRELLVTRARLRSSHVSNLASQ